MSTESSFLEQFAKAGQGYVEQEDEAALEGGYQAVRQALVEGAGLFDLAGAFQRTLGDALAGKSAEETIAIAENGIHFLMNSLAPFEMVLRAHREIEGRLRQLNEQLEGAVEQRTRELEQRVRELTALNRLFQQHLEQGSAVAEVYQGLLQRLRGHLQEVAPAVAARQEPSQLLSKLVAQLSALVEWAESRPLPALQPPRS